MAISMYSASVPVFDRMLRNLLGWLDKAEAHAVERGFDPDCYLALRLAPDMYPLTRQIQVATDGCKRCLAQLSGTDAPVWPDEETTLAELRERIRKAIDYVGSFSPEQIDGTDEKTITLEVPGRSFTFTGEDFLQRISLGNFYFHCTMTYALLRGAGVKLGKMDYLGAF